MSMMFILASQSIADTEAPTAPTLTSLVPSAIGNTLTWTASTDNVAVTGYEVWANNGSTGGYVLDATTTNTTFVSSGYVVGVRCFYYIKAYDAANNKSAASNIRSTTNSSPPT